MVDDASTLMPAIDHGTRDDDRVLALTVLYHPDVSRVGERAWIEDRESELSRVAPCFGVEGGEQRPLTDRHVSRSPIRIMRTGDGASLESPPTGGISIEGRPMAGSTLQTFDHEALVRGVVIELSDRVVVLFHLARSRIARPSLGLVGDSDAVDRVRDELTKVADLDVPVLLRGETGTGKELVARAIHAARGTERPFVAVNVAALPPTTAASELFGHVRGAFTGASHDHDGLFVRAAGGTLFLDEIGETPFDVQPMLLRVLETREVTPLGGTRARTVDVRLVAATDADLETQIAESGFRSALFHRLAGYQLFVPPLRERRDDIGRLLIHFLRIELAATGDLARLERQHEAQDALATCFAGRPIRALCVAGQCTSAPQCRSPARDLESWREGSQDRLRARAPARGDRVRGCSSTAERSGGAATTSRPGGDLR